MGSNLTNCEINRDELLALGLTRDCLDETVASSYSEIQDGSGVPKITIGKYITEDELLETCIVDDPELGGYTLTPIGEQALATDWDEVVLGE